jgi:hypothetical protein
MSAFLHALHSIYNFLILKTLFSLTKLPTRGGLADSDAAVSPRLATHQVATKDAIEKFERETVLYLVCRERGKERP